MRPQSSSFAEPQLTPRSALDFDPEDAYATYGNGNERNQESKQDLEAARAEYVEVGYVLSIFFRIFFFSVELGGDPQRLLGA